MCEVCWVPGEIHHATSHDTVPRGQAKVREIEVHAVTCLGLSSPPLTCAILIGSLGALGPQKLSTETGEFGDDSRS